MAVLREDRPYVQFNFLVDVKDDGMNPKSFSGGFQEVSGIGTEVTVAEYRTGSDPENSVRKITGLNKAADVTLKRGVIGALGLYNWINEVRNGNQKAYRDVTVTLLSEDHNPVMTWLLMRARPIKVNYGGFNAKGTDVAMEEMVLAYERLVVE